MDLLGLLNWRSHPKDLDQILQRLMEVEGSEIVKVSAALTAAVPTALILTPLLSLLPSSCRTLWTRSSTS